ncbi:hypothetical protein TNIN_89631 [Trichonephila inaurata madagascariensis]|uniref:Uncharacterized protein n=1 Tax=Trichonephila inaurata madagascariensis TaxID=2747483 RepID=A0A8X6YTS8_9ARAC|nr:hypothetical protein TNIN_89631 [Trichonephila inaurata madagascariensis]
MAKQGSVHLGPVFTAMSHVTSEDVQLVIYGKRGGEGTSTRRTSRLRQASRAHNLVPTKIRPYHSAAEPLDLVRSSNYLQGVGIEENHQTRFTVKRSGPQKDALQQLTTEQRFPTDKNGNLPAMRGCLH